MAKPISQLNKSQLRELCNDSAIEFEETDSKKELIARVEKAEQARKQPPAKDNRGRKPKELCIEDVRNQAKELIVNLRTLVKIRSDAGKNAMRFHKAAQVLEHQLRTHYIE